MVCSVVGVWAILGDAAYAGSKDNPGASKGESSQQIGQQGLGLEGEGSSPILAGPEIIIGSIKKIKGEEYTIEGDRGQHIRIRVTTDTNKVCPSSDQAKVSSGQEGNRERGEIPPTPYMQQHSGENKGQSHQAERDRKDMEQHAGSPPSRDPSTMTMKGTVGSTDPRANEDVARGSGFQIGQCAFKEGDHVRVEASDMGTATTIKQLMSSRSGE
jgi:hypothetical protein